MAESQWKNGMEEWNGRKTEETSRCECLGFQDVANAVGRQEVVRLKLTANESKKGSVVRNWSGRSSSILTSFFFWIKLIASSF
jgi:hypothetical protein